MINQIISNSLHTIVDNITNTIQSITYLSVCKCVLGDDVLCISVFIIIGLN